MLEEVGESVLVVFLLQGSDIVYDIEVGTPLGVWVMSYIIGESVLQLSCNELGVIRDDCLGPCRDGKGQHKGGCMYNRENYS